MELYDNAMSFLKLVKEEKNKDIKFKKKMEILYLNKINSQMLFDKIYNNEFNDKDELVLKKMCEVQQLKKNGNLTNEDSSKIIGQYIFDKYGPTPEELEKLKKK